MKTRLPLFVVCFTAFAARIACATPVDLFASITGTNQNGGGSIFQYTPAGMQSTFASGLDRPRGLAFDNAGNLFVDTNTLDVSGNIQGTVLKFSSRGTESTFATGFGTNITLEGMAIDKTRDVFVTAISSSTASTIVKITPGGAKSTFGSSTGEFFGLAFNHAGNLFATSDSTTGAQILEFTPGGTRSIFASSTTMAFAGLVFDKAGNLFVSAGGGTLGSGTILEFTVGGVESTFATGLNDPRGLSLDRAGNLFVAEFNAHATSDILKFTPGGVESVFASGVSGPAWLAIKPAAGVPDASSTWTLLLVGLATLFGLKIFVRRTA